MSGNGQTSKEGATFRVIDRRHHAEPKGPEPLVPSTPEPSGAAVEAEAPVLHEVPPPPPATPAPADGEVQRLRTRVDELARAYSRTLEEQKEFRERLKRENERVLANERVEIARALLESVDDLDRCLAAADASALAEGVRLIRDSLLKRISSLGIERMSLAGQPFDPTLSEAVAMVDVGEAVEDGTVIDEVVAGYRMGERVVRPAKVRVGRLAQAGR